MIRFTLTALALMLAVPAFAEAEKPVPSILPSKAKDGSCLNLRCFGVRSVREAYDRGEFTNITLNTQAECDAINFMQEDLIRCAVRYPGKE